MKALIFWRKTTLLLIDIVIINTSLLISLYFSFSNLIPEMYTKDYLGSSIVITLIYVFCFYQFKLYKSLWTYVGIDELLFTVGGCLAGFSLSMFYQTKIGLQPPGIVGIFSGMLIMLLIITFRMSFRIKRRLALYIRQINKSDFKRVLIVGAGNAAVLTINEIRRHPELKIAAVGLIDDDSKKIGTTISGIKILGSRKSIKDIVKMKMIDEIIIAIPTLQGTSKREIIEICNETGCKTKILPGIYELINGNVTYSQIREVDLEDLLGREPIALDTDGISEYIQGKVVLITGGGGSIGSELCRQISMFDPEEIIILDSYENNAYDLYNELKQKNSELNLRVIMATVTDKRRLERVFDEYRPEIVFHAAAHKHVPLMEENPTEAIKNNVFGTLNVAECADKYGVFKFVMISTDKAVNPTSIMGASKRICEMIIQAMDKQSKTEFVAVRFGNVLGSNGSVIPMFKRQIASGGPVTVTHENITRYFMTIPEAAQLVLQAGAFAEGGEIFILDMGRPIKIYDLACDLIRLSGLEPHRDIEIKITGLRPGEKLYEELSMAEEGLNTTKHKKIFVGKTTMVDIKDLRDKFEELKEIVENGSRDELIEKIEQLVPTYKRAENYGSTAVI